MKTLTLESALMVHRGLLRRETREEVEGVALCVWVRWGRGGGGIRRSRHQKVQPMEHRGLEVEESRRRVKGVALWSQGGNAALEKADIRRCSQQCTESC